MPRVILTGFEPFGPYPCNPTADAARHFDGQRIGDRDVTSVVLPCTYRGAFQQLLPVIEDLRPEAIVSMGVASRVTGIRFETIGKNMMQGKYPDADGYDPKGEKILQDGIKEIASHGDDLALLRLVRQKNSPAEISTDAEGFICNSLHYLTSQHISANRLQMRNVFFHTPWTTGYEDLVTLPPGKLILPQKTLHRAIEEIIRHI